MTINELAKEVHQNAVEHGWWEGKRGTSEIIALIHSEWSEALEEARAGHWNLYWDCIDCEKGPCRVKRGDVKACAFRMEDHKPEGIAVELIDGCIRILDFIGSCDATINDVDGSESSFESLYYELDVAELPENITVVIALLHSYTARALDEYTELTGLNILNLLSAMALALSWVKAQGYDPLGVLLMKHAYNKTRPYKHGKKF